LQLKYERTYFLQGFAILTFILNQKHIFGFLRTVVFVILFLFGQLSIILLTLLGFADHWLDVRKLENLPLHVDNKP